MRALVLALLFCAPAFADHYRSCGQRGYRPYGHKHYGYRRYSYRAYPKNRHVQRYRYLNRYYTGRSYLDHRLYGYALRYRYGCFQPRYPYGRYTRPYAALAPIYSRYGASLTLYDPIFEREKTAAKADGDGLPQARETRVGARFLQRG